MSMAEDYDYGTFGDAINSTKILKEGKIVDVLYCLDCGSINIKESKKGNLYCADLCWRN